MKKIAILLVLLLATCLVLTGCSGNNKEMISAGDFEGLTDLSTEYVLYYDGYDKEDSGVKVADYISTVQTNATSISGVTKPEGMTLGDTVLKLSSGNLGYVGVYQNVKLTRNATYKVTFDYYINGTLSPLTTGKEYVGLYFTAADVDLFNKESQVTTATGSWQTYTAYFKSENMDAATVGVQLGEKDYEVIGTAYVDNFSVQKVSSVAAGDATVASLKDVTFKMIGNVNVWFVVVGALLSFAVVYAFYIAYRRLSASKEKLLLLDEKTFAGQLLKSKYLGIVLVLAFAAVLRTLMAVFSSGFAAGSEYYMLGAEIESLTYYSDWLGKYGPSYFHAYNDKMLTPIALYVLNVIGLLAKWSGASTMSIALMIKMFSVLGDLVAVFMLYLICKKRLDNNQSVLVAALYSLMPLVFSLSGFWGVWDSMTVALILVTVYFLLGKNYYGMMVSYLFAVLFSASALYLLPFVLLYSVVAIVKSDKSNAYRAVMGLSWIIWVGLFYALSVPATYSVIVSGKAMAPITLLYSIVSDVGAYSFNAFNFASLLGKNGTAISLASSIVDILFIVVLYIYCIALYWKKKNRLELVLIASFFIAAMFSFSLRMLPYSMLLALALMLVYAFMGNDKRVLFMFAFYAAMTFVNCAVAYNVVGYTTGNNWTLIENKLVVNYLFGAINLLATMYYAYVVYDIVVAKKVLKILPMQETYASSVKAWGERVSYYLNKTFRKKAKN